MTPSILQQIQDNKQKLDNCPRPHTFHPEINQRHYRCHTCGGRIDVANYYWYYTGQCDGRANQQITKSPDQT